MNPVSASIVTIRNLVLVLMVFLCLSLFSALAIRARNVQEERSTTLTARQREIDKQQQRLNSTEAEERRDAVMRLGSLHHADASRAALPALTDPAPIVRATAAKAILSLPPHESVSALINLLTDKEVLVREEAAYALGKTRSREAVGPLEERVMSDKDDGVRAAAAVALGEIGDEVAVAVLIQVIAGQSAPIEGKSQGKTKREKNEFVLRAAAEGLGRIRSRAAVPALLLLLTDEKLASDIRREAAHALGLIGDPAAAPALQKAATDNDPYLSRAAIEALRRL